MFNSRIALEKSISVGGNYNMGVWLGTEPQPPEANGADIAAFFAKKYVFLRMFFCLKRIFKWLNKVW